MSVIQEIYPVFIANYFNIMILEKLYKTIKVRQFRLPENSYVATLFKQGEDRIAQKVGEEAIEVVIAAKNKNKKKLISEVADLWFHTLVLLSLNNISLEDIWNELKNRSKEQEK